MSGPLIYRRTLGGVAGFDPNTLDPWLWLDASDESTVTSDANGVSQWNDKAATNNATQSNNANKPAYGATLINGLKTLTFDGTNDFLILSSIAGMGNVSFFGVVRATVDGAFRSLFSIRNSTVPYVVTFTTVVGFANMHWKFNKNAGNAVRTQTPSDVANNTLYMININYGGGEGSLAANYGLKVNASAKGITASGVYGGIGENFIGALKTSVMAQFYGGLICELLMFPQLTTDNITLVENYLNDKWSIY